MKKKAIISVAYHQRKVFKRFKEKEKFVKLISELGTREKLAAGGQPPTATGVANEKLETPQKLENKYSKRYSY